MKKQTFIALPIVITLLPAFTLVAAPGFVQLVIRQTGTNTLTIEAKGAPQYTPEILQMSTDLSTTNWVGIQTNVPGLAGNVLYTNVLATNDYEFFRSFHSSIIPLATRMPPMRVEESSIK
jgi:hypothetical protein